MVDHEMTTKEKSSYPEEGYLPPKQFDIMKRYSRNEAFREQIEILLKSIQKELVSHKSDMMKEKKNPDTEKLRSMVAEISFELLSRPQSEVESESVRKEIKDLEYLYKNVMEIFLQKVEKFVQSYREVREVLLKSLEKFNRASRLAAGITLGSSALEVALLMGNALHKLLDFAWSPKLSYVSVIGANISIATSMITLSYMKQSTDDISRDLRDESRFLMDLTVLHRRGNWIDEDVQALFPHGINLNLLGKTKLKNTEFGNSLSWRHHLCCAIILTNIEKDAKLLNDENFLTKVRMFSRSQAAEIWWNRIKINKLLESVLRKVEALPVKQVISEHEAYFRRTALYLYPVLMPTLLSALNYGRTRFLFSSLALILAVHDLTTNGAGDPEEIKRTLNNIEKDFKEIIETCVTLDSDYD